MKTMSGLFLFLFLAVPVLADPPLQVVYSSGSTTTFKWTWPYHPVRVYTAVQTQPYSTTGRALALGVDASKYRFYYPERTCRNEWGYFFPKGVKLCPRRPAILFGPPAAYSEIIYQK